MKIAMGMQVKQGPYGGGNQFGNALVGYLKENQVEVVFNLEDKDIDLILMTDPRRELGSVAFGPIEIERYLRKINSKALVVHRINECDERKNTKTMNGLLFNANKTADCTVYVGGWLIDLMKGKGLKFSEEHKVIHNGADNKIFYYERKQLPVNGKIKIVTHHWSANYMKGWDIYQFIDDQLTNDPGLSNKFEFHYIGNVPGHIKTNNIIYHPPCSGKELAEKLHQCHIYLTASICEPGSMHNVEGAACGLPLVFRKSGALPEYCNGYGTSFDGKEDVIDALKSLVTDYSEFSDKLKSYNNDSLKMSDSYYRLFVDLINRKNEILEKRPAGFFGLPKALFYNLYFNTIRIIRRLGFN